LKLSEPMKPVVGVYVIEAPLAAAVPWLAAVETASCRLWGRDAADYTARYPELAVLRRWPAGTLVDGELVTLK